MIKNRGFSKAHRRIDLTKSVVLYNQFDTPRFLDGKILNVRPDPEDFRDKIYQASLQEIQSFMIPEIVHEKGQPVAYKGVSIRDQGVEGSCTGQALAAVIDLQNYKRSVEGADVPERVSARMLYEEARGYDEYPDDDLPGSSIRGAIKAFYHRGVSGDAKAPYIPGDIDWELTVPIAKDARRVTLGAYYRLRHILNDYHAALNEVQAIFCSSMIHDGWKKESIKENDGFIVWPQDGLTRPTGAHAFAIVGYDSKGFIVLNSWGEEWGKLNTKKLSGKACEHCAELLPGMAHWSYWDWQENVLDAWVLRLQAPTGRASGFSGGYHRNSVQTNPASQKNVISASSPSSLIMGHYIHVDDGKLVRQKPYNNSLNTFKQTADFLANQDLIADHRRRYDHLLFYAHGGVNDLEMAAGRAELWTNKLKKNGVYPIFYFWNTGLHNIISDVLQSKLDQALMRTGSVTDFTDLMLEKLVKPLVKPVWSEMKNDADNAMRSAKLDLGQAWDASRILFDAAKYRKVNPLKVHFVGHSAGAVLLGRLFQRAKEEHYGLEQITSSVDLLAPAVTWDLFKRTLNPFAKKMEYKTFSVYNLSDKDERADTVRQLYRKSLLYLVSRALEIRKQEPLVGMDRYWSAHKKSTRIRYVIAGKTLGRNGKGFASESKTHGGFDQDSNTLNDVLYGIINKVPAFGFE